MKPLLVRAKAQAVLLWNTDWALTATAAGMLVVLAASLAGIVLDPRTITGAPAWLKPAKFAASIALFTATMAWIFTYLPEWGKTRRFVGKFTASVLAAEFAIIALQAWRGLPSHFNVGTPLDATLFALMGAGIALQTMATAAVAIALWRQRFSDRALGWGLRLGLTISILGASVGGLMTRPTFAQREEMRAGVLNPSVARAKRVAEREPWGWGPTAPMGARPMLLGAHTVGAPDGGPGLPGTNWSLSHGDLRVPHFIGLHAMQVLPFAAIVLKRRRLPESARVRMVLVASASYAALFTIFLFQALGGESVVLPGAITATALALWAVGTAVGVGAAGGRRLGKEEPVHVAQ